MAPETAQIRLHAQWLHRPPTPDVETVVRHLVAVQAQDPRGARLTLRARSRGLAAAEVDRALTEHRSLVVTWVNRGTLHLVAPEDLPVLHALTTPQLMTTSAHRLGQEGVPPDHAERAVRAVVDALADQGPLTRAQLRDEVARVGVRTEGQALVHVLFRATLLGQVVRGPVVDGEQAFVLVRDWLGTEVADALADGGAAVDRGLALAELARRYLAAHGPATDRDLAKWAGSTLGDARRGLAAIAAELVERPDGTVDLASRAADECDEPVPPRLLGAFDTLLMGWVSRRPVLGDNTSTITSNGVFRPFVLIEGRGVARWHLLTTKGGGVGIDPFDADAARAAVEHHAAALAEEAADVARFLGREGDS